MVTIKYFTSRVLDNLIQIKLQSRHTSAKKYDLWVEYDESSVKGIVSATAGPRVVGMCSHLASVIWYLSCGRHSDLPNRKSWLEYISDASKLPKDVIDASEDESSDDCD